MKSFGKVPNPNQEWNGSGTLASSFVMAWIHKN
ncbi:hypothetical protein JOC86_002830 [Bacillus pakistanensis]|uniref:Uncharacterized protein n=1 Tax=Rossellomorea pakistanensis TaxID=992288 RepID=A0ABS2NEL0_9BACI|nr:hypothetical protein [Bacillus pakistanensis]